METNRLREFREKRGLTLAEVAKLMDFDISTVSRHESGDRGMDKETVLRYAKLYRCESYELFIDMSNEQTAT